MKFIADENISRLVIERLRTAGFDVVAVRDLAPGISDRDVLKTATAEERIVLTEDRDFGELVIRQRINVEGVILLELERLTNDGEAEMVLATISAHAAALEGKLVVLEPGRVRVRPLR
jgi:predicted nuclease of predicted toxin-antitoxin system